MEDLGRYISVNTPDLIERVFDNPGSSILKIPFNTFKMLLGMVAQRAIELNDPELNILMLRLALYEANPDERGELIDKEYEKLNKESNKQMTDEEMAKEFANEKCKDCYMCSYSEYKNPYKICQRWNDRKQAFLAGLKADRQQWHDLRKDPNDLPRQGVELLVSVDGYTRTAMYSKETNSFTCQEGVIAWMYEPEFI